MNKYIIEAIGTFFLLLTIGLTGNPLAIGAVLMVMVYMGGYISGGHFNPAVTLAVYLQKGIAQKDAIYYVVSQFFGGIAASMTYALFKHQPLRIQPDASYSLNETVIAEAIFTFALCSVVLHTAVSKKNTPNQFFGLAIGATVMVGAFAVGSISGGAFNPAVGLSPLLANFSQISSNTGNVLLYLIGPLLGSVLASTIYSFTTKSKV
jgi:aquaporin Z